MNFSLEHALLREKVLNQPPDASRSGVGGFSEEQEKEMLDPSRVELECIKPRRSSIEVLFGTAMHRLGNLRAIKRPPVQKPDPTGLARTSLSFCPRDEEPLSKLELIVMVAIPIIAVLATWILWLAYG